jgi:hypothetical protein
VAGIVRLAIPSGDEVSDRRAGKIRCAASSWHRDGRETARLYQRLELPKSRDRELLTELLREAMGEVREAAVAAAKAVCLEIAEDEAEKCRSVGASAAGQLVINVAARIRKRHVGE